MSLTDRLAKVLSEDVKEWEEWESQIFDNLDSLYDLINTRRGKPMAEYMAALKAAGAKSDPNYQERCEILDDMQELIHSVQALIDKHKQLR